MSAIKGSETHGNEQTQPKLNPLKQGVIDFFSNDLDEIPSRLRFLFGLQKKNRACSC